MNLFNQITMKSSTRTLNCDYCCVASYRLNETLLISSFVLILHLFHKSSMHQITINQNNHLLHMVHELFDPSEPPGLKRAYINPDGQSQLRVRMHECSLPQYPLVRQASSTELYWNHNNLTLVQEHFISNHQN